MNRIKYSYSLLFIFVLSAFVEGGKETNEFSSREIKPIPFESIAQNLYWDLNEPALDTTAFYYALKGFYYMKDELGILQKNTLTIIDYSRSANEPRFFMIDLDNQKVRYKSLVAHGRNTGAEYAYRFSNRKNSYQSSLGFYITGESYFGKHGLSLRLDGVEPTVNDNARDRDIVIHSAEYVSNDFIRKYGRLGRSLGCPALPQSSNYNDVIEQLKDGSCVFVYFPNQQYLSNSTYINSFSYPQSLLADEEPLLKTLPE